MQALVRTHEGAAVVSRARPILPAKPGWARVRLLVAGLCRTDVYAARGHLPCAPATVLGHEAAGVIVAFSDGSSPGPAQAAALADGTLVAFHPYVGCEACVACHAGNPHRCDEARMLGLGRDGVFAEEVVVPIAACVPLPGVHDPRVAAFLEPYAAALAVARIDVPRSARVLVLGAGRIATLCAQVLSHEGFLHVTCADRPPAGESYDVGVETRADEEALDALARVVRPGGTLVLKSRPATRVAVSVGLWAQRDLRVQGVSYAPFELAAAGLAAGRFDVTPWLGALHSFESFRDVLLGAGTDAAQDSSEHGGKPLLACSPPACAA